MGCRHKSKHKPRHHTHAIKAGSTIKGLTLLPVNENLDSTPLPQASSHAAPAAETPAAPQPAA